MGEKLLQVRVTAEEWARLRAAADARGFRAVSEWVRVTLLREAESINAGSAA